MRYSAKSHTGLVRRHNEDAFACDPGRGLFIIADGMGGHAHGEVASRMAVDRACHVITGRYDPALPGIEWNFAAILENAVHDAQDQIVARNAGRYGPDAMGTTLIAVILADDRLHFVHVGDSRLYILRPPSGLEQITVDQTLAQQKIERGEAGPEAALAYGHILTSHVGTDEQFAPVLDRRAIAPGDMVIACTDGLSDMLDDREIEHIAIAHAGDTEAVADALIGRANENGGRDNITVIVIEWALDA